MKQYDPPLVFCLHQVTSYSEKIKSSLKSFNLYKAVTENSPAPLVETATLKNNYT
jgi:hypothetical protein